MTDKKYKRDKLFIDIAKRFAEESHCLKHKVCALAVLNDRIIGTGINGTLSGQENCDDYFRYFLRKEKDSYIVYSSLDELIITDFFKQHHHEWALVNERHAEQSLVSEIAKSSTSLNNATIYLTLSPCTDCCKLLAGTGIKEIVYLEKYERTNEKSFDNLRSQSIIIRQFIER